MNRETAGLDRTSWYYVLPSLAFLLVICLHWAQPPTTIAQIDLYPPYGAANLLAKCAPAWNHFHTFIGSVDNCFSWTPYFAALALFERLFGASYAQALIFALPVIVSWPGAFLCARNLGASPLAAFAAAWLYAFNPARQSTFGMNITAELFAAALPWIFYWVMLAALVPERRRFAAGALTTSSFGLLVVLGNTPQLLVALLLGTLIWLALASKLTKNRGSFWKWVSASALLVVAASLWWVVPNVASYFGVTLQHSINPLEVAWAFYRASLLNELRFCAAWIWQFPEYNPWSVAFDKNALLYASGFLPATGLAIALIVTRGSRLTIVRWLTVLAMVMLFIAKGTHAPLAVLNLAFYRIPGMFAFIEPYGAIFLAALAMALASGLAVQAIVERWQTRSGNFAAAGFVIVAVGAVLWNNLASVTGAIFHEQTNILPNVHINPSAEWGELAQRLNADPNPGGVAILPPDDFYQIDYDWGYHGVDWIPMELLRRDVLMPGVPFDYKQTPESREVNFRVEAAIEGRSSNAAEILRDIGIRFLVVRNDVRMQHAFRNSPRELEPLFGRPVQVFGALELYDLGSPAASARIVRPSDVGLPAADSASKPALKTNIFEYRDFQPAGSSGATAIPTVVGRTALTATTVAYDVVNPAPKSMVCDISFAAWPRFDTRYELRTDDGQHRYVSVKPAAATIWVHFLHVALRSGQSQFLVSVPPTLLHSFAAFYPPRYFAADRSRPIVNQVMFSNVAWAAGNGRSAFSPANSLRGIRLDYVAANDPTITVQVAGAASGSTGWFLDFDDGSKFRCFAVFIDSTPYKLNDSIRSCMLGLGKELTEDDARRLKIERLTLATRYASERLARLQLESQPIASVERAEDVRVGDSLQSEQIPLALGQTVSLAASGPVNVAISQAYSPTWIAVEPGVGLLAHERASGWRNAWLGKGPGRVYIINWLVLCQFVLLVIGALVAAISWKRR